MPEAALSRLLACPRCHGGLDALGSAYACSACRASYSVIGGVPVFAPVPNEAFENGDNFIKNLFKRWPRLYHALVLIVGPSLFTGVTSRVFLRRYARDGAVLSAGSGPRRLGSHVVNLDIFPLPHVDVVGDLTALPFHDGAFDAATCEQVLEHVPDPTVAAKELRRVVRPGGLIHVACPFLFPWHPSPSDFNRWTIEGLSALFPGCSVVSSGVTAGPFSALSAFLPAFLASVLCFGSLRARTALESLFLLPLIPVKLLDLVFARLPYAERFAANLFVIVRVPPSA